MSTASEAKNSFDRLEGKARLAVILATQERLDRAQGNNDPMATINPAVFRETVLATIAADPVTVSKVVSDFNTSLVEIVGLNSIAVQSAGEPATLTLMNA